MNVPHTDFSGIAKRFSYGDRLKPFRDWFVMLGIASVLVVGSVVWNVVIFFRAVDGEAIGTAEVRQREIFDEEAVGRVESAFTKRAEEEARYRGTYQFVDPSVGGR